MALAATLSKQLHSALGELSEQAAHGSRLVDDASRLLVRARRLADEEASADKIDWDAVDLACLALQLPMRDSRTLSAGRLGRTSLRERAEHAADDLMSLCDPAPDDALFENAARILHQLPQRTPLSREAMLLADALNLEDFGITGLLNQTIQLARQGDGLKQLREGCEKRDQYGYWDARLKEFNHESARRIAAARLEDSRALCRLLGRELDEQAAPRHD